MLLDYLLECGIDYHARRRFRKWCDCTYCQRRILGTARITWGIQRFSHGYLVPGYRVKKGHIVGPYCFCEDGCANRPCEADCQGYYTGEAVHPATGVPYNWKSEIWGRMNDNWRTLPPCDNLDDAIRSRNERVRELLRVQLRSELKAMRTAHKEDPNLSVKINYQKLGSALQKDCLNVKRSG